MMKVYSVTLSKTETYTATIEIPAKNEDSVYDAAMKYIDKHGDSITWEEENTDHDVISSDEVEEDEDD